MKEYKRLLIKGVIFVALVIVLDNTFGVILNILENKALEKSPSSMQVDYTIRKVQSDMVIIGASEAAHSYIPQVLKDSLNCSVYNCGNDGKPALYQIAMVNCILDRYVPKYIIWSVSPMWLSDKNTNEDINRLAVLNPFFKDYPYCRKVIKMRSKYESIKCHSNCYVQNSNLYNYLTCIIIPKKDISYGRYLPLYGTDKNLQLQERDLSTSFSYSKDIVEEFSKTMMRCKDLGSKVILVFTPRYEKSNYSDLVSYKKIQEIALTFNAPLIEDFYRTPEIPSKYFKDFAHLNDDGARLFTSLLSQYIKNNLVFVDE